jgi:hypothetical protein
MSGPFPNSAAASLKGRFFHAFFSLPDREINCLMLIDFFERRWVEMQKIP